MLSTIDSTADTHTAKDFRLRWVKFQPRRASLIGQVVQPLLDLRPRPRNDQNASFASGSECRGLTPSRNQPISVSGRLTIRSRTQLNKAGLLGSPCFVPRPMWKSRLVVPVCTTADCSAYDRLRRFTHEKKTSASARDTNKDPWPTQLKAFLNLRRPPPNRYAPFCGLLGEHRTCEHMANALTS